MDRFITLFDSQFVYALGWTIVHSIWQSLIVLLLLIFTLFINKRASALTRYWLAVVALGCCFLISAKTYTYSYQDIAQAKVLFSQLQSVFVADSPRSWWQMIYQTVNPWLIYIVAAWICGFALQTLRYITDLVLTHQIKSHAISTVPENWQDKFEALAAQLVIHKSVRFFQSSKVLVPCVIGHVKPVILLPLGMLSQLPHEQVEAIVLHELAHIKRNDYLMNIVQCGIKVLFFFNPFVLAISKKIDIEREHCCDDIAVKVCGSPLTFAHTLSRFADISHNSQTAVAANKDEYLLLARVKRLFGQPSRLSKSVEHTIALSCVAILGLTLNVNAGTHNTSIANATTTSVQPEQVQHEEVSEQLTSITTTTPPPKTNVKATVPADNPLDSTPVENQVFVNNANKTVNTNEQQSENEHKSAHSNATSSNRESDLDENLAKTDAVSSEAAIDYLAQADQPIAKPAKHPKPVHKHDTPQTLNARHLPNDQPLIEQVESSDFEKLVTAPIKDLQEFKFIVYAPPGTEDLQLTSLSHRWKDSTAKYLADLSKEYSEVRRASDNQKIEFEQIPEGEQSTLVAQIRLKDISHARGITEECKVPAVIFASRNSGWFPGFCQYAERMKLRYEVVLFDPYKKKVVMYGRKIIHEYSASSKHKVFNTDHWQANQEAKIWQQLFEQIYGDVYSVTQQSEHQLARNNLHSS